jgi:hypothetical protein
MTGRDILQAIKPLEGLGPALVRIGEIAREATRLESEHDAVAVRVAQARAELETALKKRARADLDADQRRRLTETECAHLLAEAEQRAATELATARATLETLQRETADWIAKAGEAKRAHDVQMAALQQQKAALQGQVDGLLAEARRVAAAAALIK